MSDTPKPCCGNCRFAFAMNGALYCRRNPPTPHIIGAVMAEPVVRCYFPPVDPVEVWCGEYRPSAQSLSEQGLVVKLPVREEIAERLAAETLCLPTDVQYVSPPLGSQTE